MSDVYELAPFQIAEFRAAADRASNEDRAVLHALLDAFEGAGEWGDRIQELETQVKGLEDDLECEREERRDLEARNTNLSRELNEALDERDKAIGELDALKAGIQAVANGE